MWIDPKTNWTRDSVPLPEDFNRIEGNVRELKTGAEVLNDSVAGMAKITVVSDIADTGAVGAGGTVSFLLPPSSGHRFYLISIYSPTAATVEAVAELPGYVTWHLIRGKTGERDAVIITNQTASAVILYSKVAYVS
jgi:hypothetical protein